MSSQQNFGLFISKHPVARIIREVLEDEWLIEVVENPLIIPRVEDTSTLFVIAGMQPIRRLFDVKDGTELASFQWCVRTNDLQEVGDGSHLTSFVMAGSFASGKYKYLRHCYLWKIIINRLGIAVDKVTYHPNSDHKQIWQMLDKKPVPDVSCTWQASETDTPSYCSEFFVGDLEIGNMVNPDGDSVDVGFGFERLVQLYEGVSRVDESSLFDQSLSPIARDHVRTLALMTYNNLMPGNKGRKYVYRRLIRRLMKEVDAPRREWSFFKYYCEEQDRRELALKTARKAWRKNKHKDEYFWWDTHGILPEELHLLE